MVAIGTFNAENLFARYKFAAGFAPTLDGFTVNDLAFDLVDETAKQITAKAIKRADVDVLAVQEVESLPVLDRFNSRYLGASGDRRYNHRVLIDGNDPRAIDVAVIARAPFPITAVRSHRDRRRDDAPAVKVFSRDCLEVDIEVPTQGAAKKFTLFVNHFKSMMGGREETADRRQEQVEAVLAIVKARFGDDLDGDFAVVGDFNDHAGRYESGRANPLGALVDHPGLVNAVAELADGDGSWTHFYAREDAYTQLDYVLVSRRVWEAADKGRQMQLRIVRDGMPFRAARYTGDRFDGVGEDNPKASDHCPVVVDIPETAIGT
jgi:endonuclease/exonuclease/phosphatase family metal-dependent hydrolase